MRFLTGIDVGALLTPDRLIPVIEQAFIDHALGRIPDPGRLDSFADAGEFHVKAGQAAGVFATKVNSGFFGTTPGKMAIRGFVAVFDSATGAPIGLLESSQLTGLRTAAATAVAVRYLAKPNSSRLSLIGAGSQALHHLRALRYVMRIERLAIWSRSQERMQKLAEVARADGIECVLCDSPAQAIHGSDVCVTSTPSKVPLLHSADVDPGILVAAVGADSPSKHELDVRLVAASSLVTDLTVQCAEVGELHHVVEAGLMTVNDVRAQLGEVAAGLRLARRSANEVVVFDSTGTGFEDAAAAATVLNLATLANRGLELQF
jgi:alanine dehydrogenase